MDIKNLARKPQLIEIVLDDPAIVETYGETITFWMKDVVDINTYFDFFRGQNEGDGENLKSILQQMILNKEGKPALAKDETLPIDISVAVLAKVNEVLGKSRTKSSMSEAGNQPS